MKYSFIVPTYNSAKWIEPCINSILAQAHQHFDVIILDSGSTDNTVAWIKSINDARIRVYTTDKRLNIVENWQRITAISRNEFMTIVGHDDVLYPNYLATIDELIERFPNAGLYQAHFNFIDGNGEMIRPCLPMKMKITPGEYLTDVLKNNIEIIATGFMVRSKDYDAVGGIADYPNLLFADIELWLKLILKNYLAVSPDSCFAFRFHEDNTSKSAGKSRLIAFEKMVDFLSKLENEDKKLKSVIEKYGASYLKSYVTGASHKLIYVSKANRNNVSMDDIIESAKRGARQMLPYIPFAPEKFTAIKFAKLIDNNQFLRSLFLFYKGFKKRTF